jgi:Ser/Thr protein kinase RdoA (MazF antagonist)
MPGVISDAREVTPEWLTDILRRRGFLSSGHVARVSSPSSRTLFVSVVSQLRVEYSRDASRDAPARLFLKVSNPKTTPDAPREVPPEEIAFYEQIAPATPGAPVPRCYDAAYSRATGRSHLLLEDLSETHGHPPVPLPPTLAECELAVDCLARFHAHWWEHPRLGKDVGGLLDDAGVEELARATAARFEAFADFAGESLSVARREMIERVINTFPRPWVRLKSARGLTLTHGDAHTWNFLFPRAPGARRVYLIDWQLWHPHVGARDLAFMMTIFWYPERRASMELPLLRRYHEKLIEGGVGGYGWDDCWEDYRRSAVRNIFIPLIQWSRGMGAWYWWSNFERAMLAFEDLRCLELIED